MILVPRAKWVYNLVVREARVQSVNSVWVLASCKLAALIFTCIYPMVSAMTSYSRWRHSAFLFLGNIRLKVILNSHQWPKHSWRAVFSSSARQCLLSVNLKHFSCKQNSKQKNAEMSILAGEDLTPKNPLGRRTPTWNSTAQAAKMDGDGSNKQRSREHHSMNFKC